jgi:hypothetical protein
MGAIIAREARRSDATVGPVSRPKSNCRYPAGGSAPSLCDSAFRDTVRVFVEGFKVEVFKLITLRLPRL